MAWPNLTFDNSLCNLMLQWDCTEMIVPLAEGHINWNNFYRIDDVLLDNIERGTSVKITFDVKKKFRMLYNQTYMYDVDKIPLTIPEPPPDNVTITYTNLDSTQPPNDSHPQSPNESMQKSSVPHEPNEEYDDEDEIIYPVSKNMTEDLYSYEQYFSSGKKSHIIYKLLDARDDTNFMGNLILYNYAKTKKIDSDSLARNLMYHIMKNSLKTATPFGIPRRIFEYWAEKIVDFFDLSPNIVSLYYVPSEVIYIDKKSKKNKKTQNARGRLYKQYRYFRYSLAEIGIVTLKPHPSRTETDAEPSNDEATNGMEITLLKNIEVLPSQKDDVLLQWAQSRIFRTEKYAQLQGMEIIEKFPALKSKFGAEMIFQEFNANNDGSKDNLFNKWPQMAKKILIEARKKMEKQVAKKYRSDLNLLIDVSTLDYVEPSNNEPEQGDVPENINEPENINQPENAQQSIQQVQVSTQNLNIVHTFDYTTLLAIFSANQRITSMELAIPLSLLILPLLIPYTIKGKKAYGQWKPLEPPKTFIEHLQNHEMISATIQEKKKDYDGHNLRNQPYMVFCGPLHQLTCQHVVLDDIIYDTKGVLKSIDLCFKMFHALNMDYSEGCAQVWAFLHRYVYNIQGKRCLAATDAISILIGKLEE